MSVDVRAARPDEWELVRDLRLEALASPEARIAFLTEYETARAHDDAFWRDLVAETFAADDMTQLVAVDEGAHLGTAAVRIRPAGSVDHHGRVLEAERVDLLGVYVTPSARGRGVIDALVAAAAAWVRAAGAQALTLDVHRDNARARAAYARCGFVETGLAFDSPIGPEVEMRLELASR